VSAKGVKPAGSLWISPDPAIFPGNQLFSSHDPTLETGFRGHPRVAGRLRRVVVPRRCTQHHSRRVMVEAPPRAGPSPPPRTGPFFVPGRSQLDTAALRPPSPHPFLAFLGAPAPLSSPRLLSGGEVPFAHPWHSRAQGRRSPGAGPPFPQRYASPPGIATPRTAIRAGITPGIAPGRACPIRTEGLTNT
jgi:hypothetical protein